MGGEKGGKEGERVDGNQIISMGIGNIGENNVGRARRAFFAQQNLTATTHAAHSATLRVTAASRLTRLTRLTNRQNSAEVQEDGEETLQGNRRDV